MTSLAFGADTPKAGLTNCRFDEFPFGYRTSRDSIQSNSEVFMQGRNAFWVLEDRSKSPSAEGIDARVRDTTKKTKSNRSNFIC